MPAREGKPRLDDVRWPPAPRRRQTRSRRREAPPTGTAEPTAECAGRRGGRFPRLPRTRPIGPRAGPTLVTRDIVARPDRRETPDSRLRRLPPRDRAMARRAALTSNALAARGGARGWDAASRNCDRRIAQPTRPSIPSPPAA